MARAIVKLEVRLDGVWTDITHTLDVRNPVDLTQGFSQFRYIASSAILTFQLLNFDHAYSLNHVDKVEGWDVDILVRLTVSADGLPFRPLFGGRLISVSERPDQDFVVCQAQDNIVYLRKDIIPPVIDFLDLEPGELIKQLLRRSAKSPLACDFWQFDLSQFNINTRFAEGDECFDFDDSGDTFPWVGDRWRRTDMFVFEAIRQVCESGLYRFRVDGEGKYVFEARYRRPAQDLAATIDDSKIVDLRPVLDAFDRPNVIRTVVYPREKQEEQVIIWQKLQDTVALGERYKKETRRLRSMYRDPNEEALRVAAWEIVKPVAGIDYDAYVHVDGEPVGDSVLQFITVITDSSMAYTDWQFGLTAAAPPGIEFTLLQIRGKLLVSYDPVLTEQVQTASVAVDSRKFQQFDMPLQDDECFGVDAALWLADRLFDSSGAITVQLEGRVSQAELDLLLTLGVSQRVTMEDELSGISADYFTEFRHIRFEEAGSRAVAWYTCTPHTELEVWVFDESRFDIDARFAL